MVKERIFNRATLLTSVERISFFSESAAQFVIYRAFRPTAFHSNLFSYFKNIARGFTNPPIANVDIVDMCIAKRSPMASPI